MALVSLTSYRILQNARNIGLNVHFNTITPSDGNCFYHSVLDGLQNTVGCIPYIGHHHQLRLETCQWVRRHPNSDFILNWLQQNPSSLNNVIFAQEQPTVFATELCIRACSIMLGTAIVFTKADSTPAYPYDIFWPFQVVPPNLTLQSYQGPYLLIGHASDHFQSLFFHDFPPWKALGVPVPIVCISPTSNIMNNITNNNINSTRTPSFFKPTFKSFKGVPGSPPKKKVKTNKKEDILKNECDALNIPYVPPPANETLSELNKRRKALRELVNKHGKTKQTEDTLKKKA